MKTLFRISILLLLMSCTPKVQQAVTETKSEEQAPKVEEPVTRKTVCTMLSDLPSSQRDSVETAYVLYRDYLKAENYSEALPYWKTAYYIAPGSNGSIKYHFDDGIKLYKQMYEQTNDAQLKQSYVDSISSIYARRKSCFGEEAYLSGREGFDLYYYFSGAKSNDYIFNLFKKVVDTKGIDTDYFVINPMAKILSDKVINKELEPKEAGKYAQTLLKAVKKGLANCGNDCDGWNIINEYAPARLENLEGIKGLYDCDYYSDKYYQLFKDNPTDCETINRAYSRMKWGECPSDNSHLQEIATAKRTHCAPKVVATSPGPLRTAFNHYEEGRYQDAVNAFEEYTTNATDVDKKAKYLLLIAKIYYRDIKKYSKARQYAEKAASVKPNWGDPYILIGKLYASSGPLCGPGRGWDSQIVTWPAIDMFKKAKQVDPNASAEANKWINQYKQYMPTKEDIFQRRLKAGESFKVGCWINRTTTVRTAD